LNRRPQSYLAFKLREIDFELVLRRPIETTGLTGQVPYSTLLSSATRHLTSERLDLFLDYTLGPRSQSL